MTLADTHREMKEYRTKYKSVSESHQKLVDKIHTPSLESRQKEYLDKAKVLVDELSRIIIEFCGKFSQHKVGDTVSFKYRGDIVTDTITFVWCNMYNINFKNYRFYKDKPLKCNTGIIYSTERHLTIQEYDVVSNKNEQ